MGEMLATTAQPGKPARRADRCQSVGHDELSSGLTIQAMIRDDQSGDLRWEVGLVEVAGT
jgi:hypothetical protein